MKKYQLDLAKVGWQDPLEDGEAGPALSLQTLNALEGKWYPASKLSYLGKRSEPRENARARGRSQAREVVSFFTKKVEHGPLL